MERPVVLVVDDDPGLCLLQATYLDALGCKVFTAHDASAALQHARAIQPDAVVMDLDMPGHDSCEAIRRMHEWSPARRIPVVAVTADLKSRSKAFEVGCAACLMKPYDPPVLWAQICALLRFPDARSS